MIALHNEVLSATSSYPYSKGSITVMCEDAKTINKGDRGECKGRHSKSKSRQESEGERVLV